MNILLSAAEGLQEHLVGFIRLAVPRIVFASSSGDSLKRTAAQSVDTIQKVPSIATATAPMQGHDVFSAVGTLLELLLPLAFLIAAGVLIWKRMETRKSVELAMIEKGLDPRSNLDRNDSTRKFRALRFGTLLLGIGLGLAASLIVLSFWNVPDDYRPLVIWSSMTFSAGLALTIYHIIATSLEKL